MLSIWIKTLWCWYYNQRFEYSIGFWFVFLLVFIISIMKCVQIKCFVIKTGDFYNNRAKIISKNQMEEICKIALEVLKDYDSTWENIELDMNCHNAPAIKVIYKPQAVRCNLIFGNSTAVATTHFIESVLDKQKMCKLSLIVQYRLQLYVSNLYNITYHSQVVDS